MKTFRNIAKICGYVLMCLVSLIVLANAIELAAGKITGKEHPMVFGVTSAVVVSGSMSPTIEVNDLVVVASRADYNVGDIVMFEDGDGKFVTHRIVELLDETDLGEKIFRTKGDYENNSPDTDPLYASNIVGKVVLIVPKVGEFIGALQTPLGIACIVLLMATIILAHYYFSTRARSRQSAPDTDGAANANDNNAENTKSEEEVSNTSAQNIENEEKK